MRHQNDRTLMAAYTELDSGENDKQHSQKFRIKQVNQEFYFHS